MDSQRALEAIEESDVARARYLERFYGGYGFVKASEPYDEDGIMHIEMVRN